MFDPFGHPATASAILLGGFNLALLGLIARADRAPVETTGDTCIERNDGMSTLMKVARYQLIQPGIYLVVPGVWLALAFVIEAVVLAGIPNPHHEPRYVGGLACAYILFFVLGLFSVVQRLPFGLSLGVSRRSYYLGTIFLSIVLALVYGLALTVLQVIERSTNGWGISMHFFRIPHVLDGPWYLTWLTSFVVLTLMFVYGIWYGIVYRRWSVSGLMTFIAGQLAILLVAAIAATWTENWGRVGHFFTTVNAAGMTVALAALAVLLLIGGYSTIRRVTV